MICCACGSDNTQYFAEATFKDRNNEPWSFDTYRCSDCKKITIVCYGSEENVLPIVRD